MGGGGPQGTRDEGTKGHLARSHLGSSVGLEQLWHWYGRAGSRLGTAVTFRARLIYHPGFWDCPQSTSCTSNRTGQVVRAPLCLLSSLSHLYFYPETHRGMLSNCLDCISAS